jgi:hypothetical protein
MYLLSNFSLPELHLLREMINKQINDCNDNLKAVDEYLPPGDVADDYRAKESKRLEIAKELNVRVLTCIGIVKTNLATQSN